MIVNDGRLIPRATKEELNHRLEVILELLARRCSRKEIHTYVEAETDWTISSKQIDNYVHKARLAIYSQVDKRAERLIAESLLDYEVIYKLSLREKDYSVALRARQALDKRLGIDVYKKPGARDVSDDGSLPVGLREQIDSTRAPTVANEG